MANEEAKKPQEQTSDDSLYEEFEEEIEAPRKKKKKGRFGPLSLIILVVCIGVFVFSMYNIIIEQVDNQRSDGTVDEFQNARLEYEESLKNESNDPDGGESPVSQGGSQPSDSSSGETAVDNRTSRVVLDEINNNDIKFLVAPLSTFTERNKDTVGWFTFPDSSGRVAGLPIDLPIVYSGDNEYYLDHNFDGEENINGWVFVDFRDNVEYMSENYNTILYGHARSDNMFGGLKYLNEEPSWYNKKSNHYIYIKTNNEDMIWQIFAWYETSVAEEQASAYNYIRTSFSKPETFVEFCNILQDKNMIEAFDRFEFDGDDRILTLSTCKSYDKDIRVVVHAKLVKLRVWE